MSTNKQRISYEQALNQVGRKQYPGEVPSHMQKRKTDRRIGDHQRQDPAGLTSNQKVNSGCIQQFKISHNTFTIRKNHPFSLISPKKTFQNSLQNFWNEF